MINRRRFVSLAAAALAPAERRTWVAAGVPYAGALGIAPIVLRSDSEAGFLAMLLVFAIVWTTDIVAYFVGRAVGGPKLMPQVSPKKTWSGALGGTAAALADGTDLPEPTKPLGPATYHQPMQLARIHQYLSMATPLLWTRQQDTIGVIGLALNACYERNGYPEELERIKELLTTAQELWRSLGEIEDEADELATRRATFAMVHLADIIAVTPGA